MKVIGALTLYFLLSSLACASSCMQSFFDERSVLEADHVFIFRLLDAKVEADPPLNAYARNPYSIGTIRIIDVLKGDGRGVKSVRFQNSSSCGIRLDVGHYFVVFTSQSERILDLSEELVVDIDEKYFEGAPEMYSETGPVGRINLMLRGDLTLDEVLPVHMRKHISTAPPPPPPPPCPESLKSET
jgi:hypothetical protein